MYTAKNVGWGVVVRQKIEVLYIGIARRGGRTHNLEIAETTDVESQAAFTQLLCKSLTLYRLS